MKQTELNKVLRLHKMWLRGKEGLVRWLGEKYYNETFNNET